MEPSSLLGPTKSSILHIAVPLSKVVRGSHRLDASFYSVKADLARSALYSSAHRTGPIREIAKVFALSDFSLLRVPAANDALGVPFFTVSDTLEYDPQPTMFLSRKYEPNLDDYVVRQNWVLVSRSGSIGNVILVGGELDGKAVANHAIRIVATDPQLAALIFVYLSGDLGRTIVKSYTYGSVVDQIKPFQIEEVEIPILPLQVTQRLADKVFTASSFRTKAKQLLVEASGLVHRVNRLPQLHARDTTSLDPERQIESTAVRARDVWRINKTEDEYRLDGHHYNLMAQLAISNLKSCGARLETVGQVSQRIFTCNRFTRSYVEPDYGVPFLSGKNIIQMRPTDLKYVSRSETVQLEDLKLEAGWTLVTRSGTVGRTCFVWKNYEGSAASEHILRVVPKSDETDPGYLYAFLLSRYGYEQILRYRHGSVIDEITDRQLAQIVVPMPSRADQKIIGDKVRQAYELRAEAIRLEDEAQRILTEAITGRPAAEV